MMFLKKIIRQLTIITLFAFLSGGLTSYAKTYRLKLSTLAPAGSVWYKNFQKTAGKIKELTDGKVKFKVYPGGVMGNDDVIFRKIRVGQLDGASFTSSGICLVYKDFLALSLPRFFRSKEEIDYMLEKMSPFLENAIRKKGYEALGFTGNGFTYMFTKTPVRRTADLKSAKAWLLENDPIMKAIYKAAHVTPISTSIGDVMTALETGLLNMVFNTPTGLVALQWFNKVNYMTDIPLTYSFGTILIRSKSWNKLPENYRIIVKREIESMMKENTKQIREADARAIELIRKRGVEIIPSTPELVSDFQAIADTVNQKLMEKEVSPEMVDRIQKVLEEYRRKHAN